MVPSASLLTLHSNSYSMIASFSNNKNPSFFDIKPTERGGTAYLTHPAKRRSASGSRLDVYPSREKTLFLADLAKPIGIDSQPPKNRLFGGIGGGIMPLSSVRRST